MNKIIPPFDPKNELIQENVKYIMETAPVMHLTEDEVLQTLRLLQLHVLLLDENRSTHFSVTVYQDDYRLQTSSPEDKFMALLLDADVRGLILTTKRCRYCFGQSQYYWLKIAKKCSIIDTSSRMIDGDYGGRYYGKGWVIAPNIRTLRRWIVENSNNEDIRKLKV